MTEDKQKHKPWKAKQAKNGQFFWTKRSLNNRTICRSEEMLRVQNMVHGVKADVQATIDFLYSIGKIENHFVIDKEDVVKGIDFRIVAEHTTEDDNAGE